MLRVPYLVLPVLWTLAVLFSLAGTLVLAAEPAWNGHVNPGSATPTKFTPFYVPEGSKSYDSSSPLLYYSGSWQESFSPSYIKSSIKSTTDSGASMVFTFTGTGVEWFGNKDRWHGMASVFLDGKLVQRVDAWSSDSLRQQRLFSVEDLPLRKHTLKIVHTGLRRPEAEGSGIDIDALVVSRASKVKSTAPLSGDETVRTSAFKTSNLAVNTNPTTQWSLEQKGTTGVHAMQLAVISETHAIIIDKVEHNPLTISGHPAWAALYNLKTNEATPLSMQSNSFCAGGTFLSNGSLVNVGGNPVVDDITNAADFGDVDGLQAIRMFEPCDSEDVSQCKIYENHSRIRMAGPRWYNSVLRISDGSAMIIGGSKKGGWINNSTTNNPTVEYFPPKDIKGSNGLPVHLPFFVDTLYSNLFPIAFSLPDGKVFMAANRDAMIYDWKTNSERRLPRLPNGVRVTYPMAGTGLLLPLSPDNNYQPEVLLCGGSTIDDTTPSYEISSQTPASAQCSRMVLTDEGISDGWQVEQMPQARLMPDAVLLPTGQIFIVNGAGSGVSGYGNVKDQVGASNADNPVFTPTIYNPSAPAGQRFSSVGLPTSDIPRMYHSVATLTPSGNILVAGSNPNLDRSDVSYRTEYRVEWFNPPYMTETRPYITDDVPKVLRFGDEVEIKVLLPPTTNDIKVVLMDLGFVTHATHANSRLVYLKATSNGDKLRVTGPPNGNVYPPGPGFLYVVTDGVPSEGVKVIVGDGRDPPHNAAALRNLLSSTSPDQDDS